MSMRRKSSRCVTLALIGLVAGAGVAGCSSDNPEKRDVYSKLQDCKQDWGDETKCEPVRDGRYSSGYYYGPSYAGSGRSSARSTGSSAVGTTTVSRAGFGSSSAFHSSGG